MLESTKTNGVVFAMPMKTERVAQSAAGLGSCVEHAVASWYMLWNERRRERVKPFGDRKRERVSGRHALSGIRRDLPVFIGIVRERESARLWSTCAKWSP